VINKLFLHFSAYSFGGALIALAGVVSFPILTRVFTVEEYGVMNLISISLTIVVGLAKLGMHNSVVRYVHEARNKNSRFTNNELFNSIFFGMLLFSLAVSAVWLVVSQFIPSSYFENKDMSLLLLIVTALIPLRVMFSFYANTLKSVEKSVILTSYKVFKKYFSLGIMLLFIFFISKSLYGFYVSFVLSEFIVILLMSRHVFREFQLDMSKFRIDIVHVVVIYGAPLMMYELSSVFLSAGDRYLIQALIGSSKMGLYSAAYNLCEYVYTIFVVSVGATIIPMYMRIWEEDGEAETKKFLNKTLYYYILLAVPIVFGVSATGEGLLNIMASNKYSEGASIMPYVIAGMLMQGTVSLFAAGLYINKNTALIMWLVLFSAVINVILNFIFIPMLGIDGAAMSTLFSYIILALLGYYFGSKAISFKFPVLILIKSLIAAVIMYFVIGMIMDHASIVSFVFSVVTGTITYAVCMIAFDKNIRITAGKAIKRFV
jgi:O-antigen/teichoic acid export membrane protein